MESPSGLASTAGLGNPARTLFEHGMEPAGYLAMIYALLALAVAAFLIVERSRLGATLRMVGEDPELAAVFGIDVDRVRLAVAAVAGAIAALGGGLFAHHNTYIEPRNFDIMLGVHSLAYALIGGLGTVFGPLIGVVLDIGLLESTRVFQGYRMIVFGGLVALLLLLVRPRGLLDERVVNALHQVIRRRQLSADHSRQ
jgi:branched-chain amino acid transport system permease protein